MGHIALDKMLFSTKKYIFFSFLDENIFIFIIANTVMKSRGLSKSDDFLPMILP